MHMDLFQKRRSLKRMSEKLQLRFLKRLAYLMDHGYPLIQALDIIAWDRELEFYAEKMSVNLKKGLSIDQAFLNLHFHSTIIAYMYFAQSHGNLSYSLKQCIKMVESRLTAVQRFKQVLRYPLLLFFTFFLLLLFIKFSVLPSFLDLYVSHAGASKTILLSIKVVNIALTLGIVKVIIILLSIYLWFFMRGRLPI